MTKSLEKFRPPSRFEFLFNALVATFARFGITFTDGYRLVVVGRKSGKRYVVAVTVLPLDGRKYLVAPRGETQWVRNARAAGKVCLEKGSVSQYYSIDELAGEKKNLVLSAYLLKYRKAVQRYFPLPAGSEPQAFADIADAFPAFLLTPTKHAQ